MTPAPTRKRDAEKTKARILEVACQVFCAKNYGEAGIREIGALAGVSPTMVINYYGSKAGLFEAVLAAAVPLPEMMFHPREQFGEIMAQALFKPGKRITADALVARASGDAEAAAIAARVIEKHGIAPMAEWLGGENGRICALQIAMMSNGLVTYMGQLPMKKLTAVQRKHLQSWFAGAVQAIIDSD